jgi:hypothetical protein
VRVHFPSNPENRTSLNKITQAQQEQYNKDTNNNDTEPMKDTVKEECFTLVERPEDNAIDLLSSLTEETQSIIVTVWFENYQNAWTQNMMNQNVRGTLWRVICKNHPNVTYTEADLSHYNLNAYSYENLAKQLKIDVSTLFNGPIVSVMHDQSGLTFATDNQPEKLLKAVDTYIHQWEISLYGKTNPLCDLNNQNLANNHFESYLPYKDLEMFEPGHKTRQEEIQESKTVTPRESSQESTAPAPSRSYTLSEPEKSF